MRVVASRTPSIEIAFCLPVRAMESFFQEAPPSVLRSNLPIAPIVSKTLPVGAVGGPAGQTVQRKTGHAPWVVLINTGRPTGFVSSRDGIVIDPLPGCPLVRTALEALADHFDD